MKKDKSKNIIIVLLVTIIIILATLVITLATDTISLNSNKKTEENNQINSTNETDTQEKTTNYLNLTETECSNGCSKTIKNKNKDSILYVNSSEIKLDNQQILKFEEGPYSLPQVSVYNDIIITLQTESLDCSMIIYDFSGNIIKRINLFNDEQGKMFHVSPKSYSSKESFNVTNDGVISFVGTKHIQGSANTYIDNSGNTIDLCTQGDNISNNEIVSGIFKMSYLENNTFSNITYVSTKTTVNDIKTCN